MILFYMETAILNSLPDRTLPANSQTQGPAHVKVGHAPLYAVLAGIVLLSLFARSVLPAVVFPHGMTSVPFHSTVEALGALAAVVMAIFLLMRKDEGAGVNNLMLACGFLGMGILDAFHAAVVPGNEFVLLHSAAVFVGGFWFAMVWLPDTARAGRLRKWLPWAVATGSILTGSWVVFSIETFPAMLHNGEFTAAAKALNLFGGAMSLAGAARLTADFQRTSELDKFVFLCLAVLFGLAGLTFHYSALWDAEWWFWHLQRFAAYTIALLWVVNDHRRALTYVRTSLDERTSAEKAAEEARAFLQSVMDGVAEPITVLDPDYQVVMANKAAKDLMPAWPDIPEGPLRQVLDTGAPAVVECECRMPDGGRRWFEVIASPLFAWDGSMTKVVYSMRDISGRKGLDRQKDDFYAMLTHDLKSPLTMIMGYIELLFESERMDKETSELVSGIGRGGERLSRLVEDFLTVSKATAGKLVPHLAPEDPARVIDELLPSVQAQAREKGVDLRFEVGALPETPVDKRLLQRAVGNLVENAVNYTPRGGSVTLDARRVSETGADFLVVSVTDTGPGIAPDEQGKVFDMYYRSPKTAGIKGTGLGLAIVKAAAEAHGGRVEFESTLGKGSTFRICLPVSRKET